jgi:hypothetical protein
MGERVAEVGLLLSFLLWTVGTAAPRAVRSGASSDQGDDSDLRRLDSYGRWLRRAAGTLLAVSLLGITLAVLT